MVRVMVALVVALGMIEHNRHRRRLVFCSNEKYHKRNKWNILNNTVWTSFFFTCYFYFNLNFNVGVSSCKDYCTFLWQTPSPYKIFATYVNSFVTRHYKWIMWYYIIDWCCIWCTNIINEEWDKGIFLGVTHKMEPFLWTTSGCSPITAH